MNAPYQIPPDTCLQVSAEHVGFALPETAETIEASIRFKNLVHTEIISEKLALEALKPTTPLRQRLDILETTRKLAGLDQKKQETSAAVGGYQLVINLGGTATETFKGVTVEQVPEDSDAGL